MRGFTLLESLIYIALFGIVMGGAVGGVQALTESADRSQTHALLETEGSFLMGKIEYEVTHAQSIDEPTDTATSSELSMTDAAGNPVEIYVADSTLMRTENAAALPISTNSVDVSELSFVRSGSGGLDPESVRITFEISSHTNDGQQLSEDFIATDYLLP